MFITKQSAEEFCQDLEKSLVKVAADQKLPQVATKSKVMAKLAQAADHLDALGLENLASEVTEIMESLAWHVPESDSPETSEEMLQNLAERGVMWDADANPADDEELAADENQSDSATNGAPVYQTNDPQSNDFSTGINPQQRVDSLQPGLTADFTK